MLRTIQTNLLSPMRDIIISKANKLPTTLIFDPSDEDAGAIISLIVNASDEFLKSLSQEVYKQPSSKVQLTFFEKSGAKAIAKEIAVGKLSEYIGKGYKVEVDGNFTPYLPHSTTPPIYFVGIIFHTYN